MNIDKNSSNRTIDDNDSSDNNSNMTIDDEDSSSDDL